MFVGQVVSSKLEGSELVEVATDGHFQPPPSFSELPKGKPPPPSRPRPTAGRSEAYRSGVVSRLRFPRLKGPRVSDTPADRVTHATDASDSERGPRGSELSLSRSASHFSSVHTSRRYSDLMEAEADYSSVYTSRFAIACVAVALLWSTTLTAVTAVLGSSDAIRIPSVSVVVHEGVRFYNETLRLHDYYVDCVAEASEYCNASLTRQFEEERARSQAAKEHNERVKRRSLDAQASCAGSRAIAIAAMAAWDKALGTGPSPNRYTPSCPAASKEALRSINYDVSEQKSASVLLAKNYSNNSQSTVDVLARQIVARGEYDAAYLNNKTRAREAYNALVDSLANRSIYDVALRLSTVNISSLAAAKERAAQMVRSAQAGIEVVYGQAEAKYTQAVDKASVYKDQAEATLSSAAQTFSAIADWLQENAPETGGFEGMGISLPSLSVPAPTFSSFPTLPLDPSLPDQLKLPLESATDRLVQSLEQASQFAAVDTHGAFKTNLGASTPANPFADYNPPRVDALQVQAEHSESSRLFELSIIAQLDAFDLARSREDNGSTGFYNPFSSNATADALERTSDLSWFSYKNLEDIGLDLDNLLHQLSQIVAFASMFDLIWRVLRTFAIFTRFWARSSLGVPPIDMETDADSKSRGGKNLASLQKYALLVTSPWTIFTILIIFLYLIGTIVWASYEPMLSSYREGCTKTGTLPNGQVVAIGEGTSLTRNAYSLAFNYAATDGNRDRLRALDAHEQRRTDICARYGGKSAEDQRTVEADMNWIITAHANVVPDIELMRSCYDLPSIDASFQALEPRDVNGNKYPLMSEILSNVQCDVTINNSTLQDGVFRCSALKECVIECNDLADENGVDQSNLLDFAKSATCTAEWFGHAYALRFIFTVCVYVFINVARVIFVAGLTRVAWQQLNTGYFSYRATCNREGSHTYEAKKLAEKVEAMLSTIRLVGGGMMVLAILMQVPWIVLLSVTSDGLIYDTSSSSILG